MRTQLIPMVAAMLVTTAIAGKPPFISAPPSAEVTVVHQDYASIAGGVRDVPEAYGTIAGGVRAVNEQFAMEGAASSTLAAIAK
jgi:hypothetical protein